MKCFASYGLVISVFRAKLRFDAGPSACGPGRLPSLWQSCRRLAAPAWRPPRAALRVPVRGTGLTPRFFLRVRRVRVREGCAARNARGGAGREERSEGGDTALKGEAD
jgi:hypothetical protein